LSELNSQQCKPCEGGVARLDEDALMKNLDLLPGWEVSDDTLSITRSFKFKNFVSTMAFINAMAELSEQQGHHPDFSAGYNYCDVHYTTHAIGGLSKNDFICAAKINKLLDSEK
jgi:4a-hydroxytetrahydrobiopterin dehydratase